MWEHIATPDHSTMEIRTSDCVELLALAGSDRGTEWLLLLRAFWAPKSPIILFWLTEVISLTLLGLKDTWPLVSPFRTTFAARQALCRGRSFCKVLMYRRLCFLHRPCAPFRCRRLSEAGWSATYLQPPSIGGVTCKPVACKATDQRAHHHPCG